jgi:casein kinase II subunit beta
MTIDDPRRFPPRIIEYDGFSIWAKPYQSCPEGHPSWVKQFCQRRVNSWYVRIAFEYLNDRFNYYGLEGYVPNFRLARELITDTHSLEWRYLSDSAIIEIHEQGKQLYGLIHARWICTTRGLSLMRRKAFKKRRYGLCPRFYCRSVPLLPMGTSPIPNRHSAKLFCVRCADIYKPPPEKRFDGAHFGPAFPSVFLVICHDCDGRGRFFPPTHRIFGFKIYRGLDEVGPHASNVHRDEAELRREENVPRGGGDDGEGGEEEDEEANVGCSPIEDDAD